MRFRLSWRWLVPLGFLSGVGVLCFADPATSWWLPGCFFHRLTTLHCPGCGNTRAFHALVHGDWRACVAYNPLFLPLLVYLLVACLYPRLTTWHRLNWVLAGVIITFFVLRNLPWMPFTLLAPPA